MSDHSSEESFPHPGVELYNRYIQAYESLDPIEKAQHKIAQSKVYTDYCAAKIYGIQIYNVVNVVNEGYK